LHLLVQTTLAAASDLAEAHFSSLQLTAMAKIINEPSAVVGEMLASAALTNPAIKLLDGYHVVVRAALDKAKVAIISGGGSGHEPSHAGWVADGMLSAAVCGNVFASPSTASVLAAIMHCTGAGGCLLIVKNYTGDRLNFGLAAEQAKAAGLAVELLVVGDDCAIAHRGAGIAGRRGIAGTCLVHKVAGAAAEAGLPLAAVVAEAAAAAAAVGSMGVALTSCTLPGKAKDERIGAAEMEVGLGIHGEPGAMTAPVAPAKEVVASLLQYITSTDDGRSYLTLPKGEKVALLVNNLGGTTAMELAVAAGDAVAALRTTYGVVVERCYVGSYAMGRASDTAHASSGPRLL
jgi:dihydroxyacetone kinase